MFVKRKKKIRLTIHQRHCRSNLYIEYRFV